MKKETELTSLRKSQIREASSSELDRIYNNNSVVNKLRYNKSILDNFILIFLIIFIILIICIPLIFIFYKF
jgi:hypothetical protein